MAKYIYLGPYLVCPNPEGKIDYHDFVVEIGAELMEVRHCDGTSVRAFADVFVPHRNVPGRNVWIHEEAGPLFFPMIGRRLGGPEVAQQELAWFLATYEKEIEVAKRMYGRAEAAIGWGLLVWTG